MKKQIDKKTLINYCKNFIRTVHTIQSYINDKNEVVITNNVFNSGFNAGIDECIRIIEKYKIIDNELK